MSSLSRRDERVVLWLACAAACWRWFVAMRTPMPSVEACSDMYLAQRLVAGDFAELTDRWNEPLYGLLLAPFYACGAPPFLTAQIVACVLGGLLVVAVAFAAERLREGAAVPAAVIAMATAGCVIPAAAGGATSLLALLGAIGLWAWFSGRTFVALLVFAVLVLAGHDPGPGNPSLGVLIWPSFAEWMCCADAFTTLRLAGVATVYLPLLVLRPRVGKSGRLLLLLLLTAIVSALWMRTPWTVPYWHPAIAVLAGVGLARLPLRLRDVLLCVVIAVELHAGWTLVEDRDAVAERLITQYLIQNELPDWQNVSSPLQRVRYYAGHRPAYPTSTVHTDTYAVTIGLEPQFGALVLPKRTFEAKPSPEWLHEHCAPAYLPPDLQDLADAHDLVVLRRKP